MKKSGVTVHILEPGRFKTNFTNLDRLHGVDKAFNNADEDVKRYYGEEYKDKSMYCTLFLSRARLCFIYESLTSSILGEQGKDLTQSHDKSHYTPENSRKQSDNTKRHKNLDCIMWTDIGRSVGVATTINLVFLNRFT